jgi:predicted enzyme related to lactoylglutathione lyase
MATRFNHTNIVARDPERLGAFYIEVFGCVRFGADRNLAGDWLERGMGLPGARVRGFFLRLPGHGDEGPTLEIYSLDDIEPGTTAVNRPGLMHIAFNVDDIEETVRRVLIAGGRMQGEIVEANVPNVGRAGFVYTRDPEENIVELLEWR